MEVSKFKKRHLLVMVVSVFLFVAGSGSAESVFDAAALPKGSITAETSLGVFAVTARADKAVVVDAPPTPKLGPDGKALAARLKLGGAGATDFRSLRVTAKEPGTLVILLNSNSRTDVRILKVVNDKGEPVGTLPAPVDADDKAGVATVALAQAGTYYLYSAGSGINLYRVTLK